MARTISNHPELQYLHLVKKCLRDGTVTKDRTGTGTKEIFGASMRFSLRNNTLPLLTTKRVAFKTVLRELLFFVNARTDNTLLTKKGVHIWTANSTKEFFAENKIDRREGDLGPIYGFQWRHYGADYSTCDEDYTGQGYDQLANALSTLRNQSSHCRRVVISAWNPLQLGQMALPPCHCLFQFQRDENRLHCALYQRSADLGLGVPFNIASYSILTIMAAHLCDLEPGDFVHFIGNAHVYLDHQKPLQTQIQRTPLPFPTLAIDPYKPFKKWEDFTERDFTLKDYKFHPMLVMKMSA